MITSSAYFQGFLNIATGIAPSSDTLGDDKLLDNYINKYEREVLTKSLGYSLYKEFQAAIDDTSGKWYELLNGKEYQVDDVDVVWRGLIFEENDFNRSLIANYVYYFYLMGKQKTLSGVGMVRNSAKNAVSTNSTQELVIVWNEFVDMVQEGGNGERSLYQFIDDMNDLDDETYENWLPTEFEYKNNFGL